MDMKSYIAQSDFEGLFTQELLWNLPQLEEVISVSLKNQDGQETRYRFSPVADCSGFKVFTCEVTAIPTLTTCRKLDRQLQKNAFDYIAIYYIRNSQHHAWIVPVRRVEKRDLVLIEYASANQTTFLIEKLKNIRFNIGAKPFIADVRAKVQRAFLVNSERITKDFYSGFRKQHDAFSEFIQNLPDEKDRKWYTSVMLNRLMFCYFIQKKGFLDRNTDYLSKKLKEVQQNHGEGQYYSFYRAFLRRLFSDGLNTPESDRKGDFENNFGQIPYLNGGMFAEHQIEHDHPDLDIADEAFESLFAFFDTYQWHLDTRITATGKDINPDVLGYIFEQYINDRAAMGAYYTKEDITEYIGKNCIIPYLLDALAKPECGASDDFRADGFVWNMMQASGERYIYDAVKKGYTDDWRTRIPQNIEVGLDTTQPNLLERRQDWNTKTPEEFALPTEIWRETIARLQRCEDIKQKIAAGEICHANDLITYNLDMRQFAYDLIDKTDNPQFVMDFFDQLKKITILDPTCGSGAFLFAALNILEPLYEICIERMHDFAMGNGVLADQRFDCQLEQINTRFRSNIQYYIYKTIILNNLYGVDIMHEAVEIAKLRLFLKLVAVVDVDVNADNLGLDPLPDIDFNIRCGNTLVGYATEGELRNALKRTDGTFDRLKANQKKQQEIKDGLDEVADAYTNFKLAQSNQSENVILIKETKDRLSDALDLLNNTLNRYYHKATRPDIEFELWKTSHQPFHWLAEFYTILHGNNGFDVIIGNPPYVKVEKVHYISKSNKCHTNLYAYIVDRCFAIEKMGGFFSMIVPLSIMGKESYVNLREKFGSSNYWFSSYSSDTHPGVLFKSSQNKKKPVEQNLSIFVSQKMKDGELIKFRYSTSFCRFLEVEREDVFDMLSYEKIKSSYNLEIIPQIGDSDIYDIFNKLTQDVRVANCQSLKGARKSSIYYHDVIHYWPKFTINPSVIIRKDGGREVSSHYKQIDCSSELRDAFISAMNSTCFYLWYISISNGRDVSRSDVLSFPFCVKHSDDAEIILSLKKLSNQLCDDVRFNKSRRTEKKKGGDVNSDVHYINRSKHIIDEIDKVLAKHYGFTEEELDFIINYDIKYRMGDELEGSED